MMTTNTKVILEGQTGPITQSVDAIKSLLAYVGRASSPLPSELSIGEGRLVLVLSATKDSYYAVTPAKCSCPAATYPPGLPCNHRRAHFGAKLEQVATAAESGSIRPECKWPGGLNGPVDEIRGVA